MQSKIRNNLWCSRQDKQSFSDKENDGPVCSSIECVHKQLFSSSFFFWGGGGGATGVGGGGDVDIRESYEVGEERGQYHGRDKGVKARGLNCVRWCGLGGGGGGMEEGGGGGGGGGAGWIGCI